MKPRLDCVILASAGISFLLLASIRCVQAAEIKIVSPSEYADTEGEGVAGGTSSRRFQQVLPAEDFAALGNQPHWIVGFTIRPDQSMSSPRTVHFPDNEIYLSTTESEPDTLSLDFDDNRGQDVMQFYRGPVTFTAGIDARSPVPRPFYHADFPAGVTHFVYDPSQGNLLFDGTFWEGNSPSTLADQAPGIESVVFVLDPNGTLGAKASATIFQFTLVPVGDYNHDGTLDAADIDDLTTQTVGGTNPGSYDLNADALVNGADINIWVKDLFKSWIGDANLDGQFNSSDLVSVLAAGAYEMDVDAVWSRGDFNGDGRTNSSDLVAALADGGYENGARPTVPSVPEPATPTLVLMAIALHYARRPLSSGRCVPLGLDPSMSD